MKTQKASMVVIRLFMLFISVVLILGGCQKEIVEISPPSTNQVIKPHSTVANLMERIALRDGSYDNILDKSSCISLKLPVTVVVNGQTIVIHTEDQFDLVKKIFEESSNDKDTLSLVFPVTIINADYSQQLIKNQGELDAITKKCVEGGGDKDIECVDFKYPISFSLYDLNNQVYDVIIIKNDYELFYLIIGLDSGYLLSLTFPVTLLLSGGQEINVNDNIGLEGSIENHQNDCNEHDDNNYKDDEVDRTPFINVLTNGAWKITRLLNGTTDQTAAFTNFSFRFNVDGTALSTDRNSLTNGIWDSYSDNGYLGVELDFGSETPYNTIHGNWKITEFGNQVIKLKHLNYVDDSIKTLVFENF